jgi:hypothetical protein
VRRHASFKFAYWCMTLSQMAALLLKKEVISFDDCKAILGPRPSGKGLDYIPQHIKSLKDKLAANNSDGTSHHP